MMYVLRTNQDVNSDNLCIYGFIEALLKMSARENDKTTKFGFSIVWLLFGTYVQYLPLNLCSSES